MSSSGETLPENSRHILEHLVSLFGSPCSQDLKVICLKSAQQQVWLLENLQVYSDNLPQSWRAALKIGNNRLVARQWKASSCWWNLNRNQADSIDAMQSRIALARSEVAGYRIARTALPKVNIPDVLYFSHDVIDIEPNQQQQPDEHPWAILTYVGHDSTLFESEQMPDHSWMEGMVKSRFEFSFEEPHPRWGRVPENECVDYAKSVLRQVILPMHRYIRDNQVSLANETDLLRTPNKSQANSGYTYRSMVDIYQKEQQQMKEAMVSDSNDPTLEAAIDLLEQAIEQLKTQQPYFNQPLQPLVLCHMDCQPQNLLFAQSLAGHSRMIAKELPRISSVLDWEEAALADARFELLLMCRKICANREQAEAIWKMYEDEYHNPQGDCCDLGPLQPWLALETVHSITSLLLQSMNLLCGGRSPWESKPDLQGKIQREFRRLIMEHGWTFCDVPQFR